jgi:hypothetical protein
MYSPYNSGGPDPSYGVPADLLEPVADDVVAVGIEARE